MGRLEESLRETFASRAAQSPTVDGLADRVIVLGRRRLRSRQLVAGIAALLAVSLIGFGAVRAVGLGGPDPSEPAPTTTDTAGPIIDVPADLLLGDRIVAAGGRSVSLTDVINSAAQHGTVAVHGAWRVTEGWLVQTIAYGDVRDDYPDTEFLWLVPDTGRIDLVVVGHSIMVSPPAVGQRGVQVAWVSDGMLHLGTYAGPDIDIGPVTSIPVPSSPEPYPVRLHAVTIVGPAILLAGTQTGGGLDAWGAWLPGVRLDNDYPAISLLGVTLDRSRVIANYQGAGNQRCLGELEPVGFTPVHSLCPTPVTDFDLFRPSPDGRWWMVTGFDGLALYASGGLWAGSPPAQTWPTVGWGEWRGDAFVAVGPRAVTVVSPGHRPEVTATPLPSDVEAPMLIEDLRRFGS